MKTKYDVVEYSYNELYYNAKQQYEFYENTYAIYAYSVDVMNNSSVIFAEEENEELSRVLKDQNVVLEVTGAFKEETTVTGGSPLNNSITLAGSGTYNGSTAFITCGHSLSGGSSVSYAGSTIGTVVVDVNSSGSSGDYSIISAASGYTPTSNVFSGGGNVVHYTGYVYHPSVGTNLYKYGSVSGSATCQVSHYSITVNGRTGLVGAKLTSGTTQSGDSGGPYRSGYSFCGIHMGSSTEPDGTVRVFFTPYQTVYNAGFTIKIN